MLWIENNDINVNALKMKISLTTSRRRQKQMITFQFCMINFCQQQKNLSVKKYRIFLNDQVQGFKSKVKTLQFL